MKLAERLALLKAGYSKDEINALIDEDQKAAELEPEVVPAEEKPNDYMKVISALAGEVKDLKEAVYAKNIQQTEIKMPTEKTAEDILAELFSAPKKED